MKVISIVLASACIVGIYATISFGSGFLCFLMVVILLLSVIGYFSEGKHPEAKPLSKGIKILWGFITAIVVLFVVIFTFSTTGTTIKEDEKPKEEVVHASYDGSVVQVVIYLKNNLNDPISYEDVDWSPIQKISDISSKYTYSVRHKYRAKNGFGALVLQNQVFYLDKEGNVVNVKNWQ